MCSSGSRSLSQTRKVTTVSSSGDTRGRKRAATRMRSIRSRRFTRRPSASVVAAAEVVELPPLALGGARALALHSHRLDATLRLQRLARRAALLELLVQRLRLGGRPAALRQR